MPYLKIATHALQVVKVFTTPQLTNEDTWTTSFAREKTPSLAVTTQSVHLKTNNASLNWITGMSKAMIPCKQSA